MNGRVRLETADGVVLWFTAETPGVDWQRIEQWHRMRCQIAGEPPVVVCASRPEYANLDEWGQAALEGLQVRGRHQPR